MTNTVLLDSIAHADLTVAIGYSPAFGDAINQCVVFANEFDAVQREYPILFRRDQAGAYYSVALLGLDRDENLFLDAAGWQARHVPAVRQRGAFAIGMVERLRDGIMHREPMLHVDLDHPRVDAADGQPVFLPHGGHSPYLDHIVRVLQTVHDGLELRAPLFAALEAADLIEPIMLDVALDEHSRYEIPDCYTVGAERLAQLDGAALETLNRAGFLRHAFTVAASLGNVARLIELKNRQRRIAHGVPVAAGLAA